MQIARAISPKAAYAELKREQQQHRRDHAFNTADYRGTARHIVVWSEGRHAYEAMRYGATQTAYQSRLALGFVTKPIEYVGGAVDAMLGALSYTIVGAAFGVAGLCFGAVRGTGGERQALVARAWARTGCQIGVMLSVELTQTLVVVALRIITFVVALLLGAVWGLVAYGVGHKGYLHALDAAGGRYSSPSVWWHRLAQHLRRTAVASDQQVPQRRCGLGAG